MCSNLMNVWFLNKNKKIKIEQWDMEYILVIQSMVGGIGRGSGWWSIWNTAIIRLLSVNTRGDAEHRQAAIRGEAGAKDWRMVNHWLLLCSLLCAKDRRIVPGPSWNWWRKTGLKGTPLSMSICLLWQCLWVWVEYKSTITSSVLIAPRHHSLITSVKSHRWSSRPGGEKGLNLIVVVVGVSLGLLAVSVMDV